MVGVPVARFLDDQVLKFWPAGPAEVRRRDLFARRPTGGRPEVVSDHVFKQIYVLIKIFIENQSVQQNRR